MTGEALDLLTHYHWPGNVRELKNLVEHLVILAPNATITPEDIPAGYHTGMMCESALADKYLTINNFKDAKKAFERLYIRSKLAGNKGNITRTAMQIGVGRSYLHKKLKQLDL